MPFISCIALCLLCSVPFGLVVSLMLCDNDPRLHHSQNIGMSNVWRTSGSTAGLLTLSLDILKAIVSLALCQHFFASSTLLVLGFFCVFFHCYSIFLKGKGGKGVAASAGVLAFFIPTIALYTALIWFFIWVMTQKASIASLGASVLGLTLVWYNQQEYLSLVLAMTVLIIWRHKSNISRLLKKEELSF